MRPTPGAVAALAVICASTFSYAADISFHRSLTVSSSETVALNVCNNSGMIDVHGTDGNKINISAKIHKSNWHAFGNEAQMKDLAAKPPIQQTGNAIHVGDKETCDESTNHNVDIDYEISVPKNTTVIANSGSGNIHVEGVSGFVHANTAKGDIVANGIGSDSKLQTRSGTIDIQDAHGTLRALSGSGSLDLRDSQLSDATLQTASGSITTTKLHGGLRANSGSGNLLIAGLPTSDWEMETSSGNIRFEGEANAKFNLDAESGSGKLISKLPNPVSDHASSGVLKIPVNGGGPEVKMYTRSGNIDLQ